MNSTNKNTETVSGLIERVTFHSEESGFAVLWVKISGHRELITVVGTLASVTSGEWLKAQGRWFSDPRHGQQFKAEVLETSQPDTAEGIRRYLGSGMIKGIGPKFASRLVNEFGTKVPDVIERFPRKLLEVDGIGKIRLERIRKAWAEQKSIREIMIFLHSHGVGTSRAFRIYKNYGDEAIPVIQENPYCLANDIWGIGFKTADDLAASLGIEKESDIRARAGVEYVLSELTNEGHCAYPRTGLIERAAAVLEIRSGIVSDAVDHLLAERRLVKRIQNESELIYLTALDMAEHYLARNLAELAQGKHPCPKIDVSKALEWVEQKLGFELAAGQRKAVKEAIEQKVVIITGGPGVGKTTLVNAIVRIFRAKKLRVVLCAPTGRAAISERIFNTFNEIEYQDNGTDWKFSIDLSHELPADIFVEYNQVTTENKFRYILTSANTWKEPLEEAEFLIKIPLKYELEKCSYRTKQLKSNDEFNLYLIEQRDFSPHKELTFSWVETGAN